MATFFLECYAAGAERRDVGRLASAARAAAEAGARQGLEVRHVRSLLAPADEICFHVFEAESASAVERMAALARLAHERVTEVVGSSSV
jgi:hypothetical protein